jgi:uncharacterized phage protein (TIGR01671 family)
MNRIPNYRVWHKIEKRFVDLRSIDFELDNIGYDCQGEANYYDVAKFDEIVFQQYTGLKDSKGVDIYEGDILEIQRSERDNAFKKYSQVGVVEFRTGIFLFSPNGPDNENYYTIIGFHELFHYNEKHLGYYAPKIIGNIFESKELINNEN